MKDNAEALVIAAAGQVEARFYQKRQKPEAAKQRHPETAQHLPVGSPQPGGLWRHLLDNAKVLWDFQTHKQIMSNQLDLIVMDIVRTSGRRRNWLVQRDPESRHSQVQTYF